MRTAWATAPLSPCYPSFRHGRFRNSDFTAHRQRGYFNPAAPCYSGTIYASYSAVTPFELPKPKAKSPRSDELDQDEARSQIEGKGYLDVSSLEKDRRGIWRGKATMNDGRSVGV